MRKQLRSRARYALVAAALGVALTPSAAQAGDLDQSQPVVDGAYPVQGGDAGMSWAQTFTAGRSGHLDRVDLHLQRMSPTAPLTVEIRNTEGGVPGTSVLGRATVAAETVPTQHDWVAIAFDSPVESRAGTQYAIVTHTAGAGGYHWYYEGSDGSYAGGRALNAGSSPPTTGWVGRSEDMTFKTYVGDGADVLLEMSGPASVAPRSEYTYTLTVANAGPSASKNVVISDNLPFGTQYIGATSSQGSCTPPSKSVRQVVCQLGDIADDGSATIALRVKVTAGAGSAYLNNVATVTTDTNESDTTNNSDWLSTTVSK